MSNKSPSIKVTKKEYLANRKFVEDHSVEIYEDFEIPINSLDEFLEYCKNVIYPNLLENKKEHLNTIKNDIDYLNEFTYNGIPLKKRYENILDNKIDDSITYLLSLGGGTSSYYFYETMDEYKERRAREIRSELQKKNRPKKSKKDIEGYISKLTPEELEKVKELIK